MDGGVPQLPSPFRSLLPSEMRALGKRGALLFAGGAPPEDARLSGVSPGSAAGGGGGGKQPGSICIPEYRCIPEQGGTVPKEMVSSPLNPLLRFRK